MANQLTTGRGGGAPSLDQDDPQLIEPATKRAAELGHVFGPPEGTHTERYTCTRCGDYYCHVPGNPKVYGTAIWMLCGTYSGLLPASSSAAPPEQAAGQEAVPDALLPWLRGVVAYARHSSEI